MSTIHSIVYRPQHDEPQPETHFRRHLLDQVQLVAGYGIEGDMKGGREDRQLNIMCLETLQDLGAEGFKVDPGQMGEQIIISGLDIDALPVGTVLQIGDSARVQLVTPRTGCKRFVAIQGKPNTLAAGRLGMMANVIRSGEIQPGATVRVVEGAHV